MAEAAVLRTAENRGDSFFEGAFKYLFYLLIFFTPLAKAVEGPAYALCASLFIVDLIRQKAYPIQAKVYYYIILAYLGVAVLSLTYTPDLADGIGKLKQQLMIIMVVVLIEKLPSLEESCKYLWAYAGGISVLSGIALFQGVIKHIERPPTLMNAVHGGVLLVFGAVVLLTLAFHARSQRDRLIAVFLLLLDLGAVYLNGTRGAWLALAVALFLFPFLTSMGKVKKTVYLAVVLIAGAGTLATPFVSQKIRLVAVDLTMYRNNQLGMSVGPRLEMWKASGRMFRDNPVLGVGIGGWHKELEAMVNRREIDPSVLQFNQTHSIYMDALSTRGIIGLFSLLVLLLFPVLFAWKRRSENKILYTHALILVTVVFLVAGLTDTLVRQHMTFMAYISITGVCMAALVRGAGDHQ